jgi:hypothetical protein
MLWHIQQAYLALADYVECETDIKRALLEDPKNVGVRLLQKEYKQKVGPIALLHVEGRLLTLGAGNTALPLWRSCHLHSLPHMKAVPSRVMA